MPQDDHDNFASPNDVNPQDTPRPAPTPKQSPTPTPSPTPSPAYDDQPAYESFDDHDTSGHDPSDETLHGEMDDSYDEAYDQASESPYKASRDTDSEPARDGQQDDFASDSTDITQDGDIGHHDAHADADTDKIAASSIAQPSSRVSSPRLRRKVHPRQAWGPPWLTPVSHRTQIDTFWLMIAMLMLALGVIFFGWRAMLSVSAAWLATLATYLVAAMIIKVFKPKRMPDSSLHVLTMGLFLGVSLPVMRDPWIPICAGMLLGLLCHGIGRSHRVRIHPVAAALVLAWVLPNLVGQHSNWQWSSRTMVTEPAVLQLDHVILGDLYNTPNYRLPLSAWWENATFGRSDATRRPEPMDVLLNKTNNIPSYPNRLADLLSQSKLPRVEELLIGCVPGPIGATSKAVIIVIGLVLMYRRISWWTMAVAGIGASLVMLAMLPVSVDQRWTLMAVQLWHMGPALAFVYIGYFLLASPLLWILLILAPSTAPMSSRGKVYYGLLIGAGTIVAVWYTGNWAGGFIALMVASLFSRPLDALQQSPMHKAR